MLKARAMAGDRALARDFVDLVIADGVAGRRERPVRLRDPGDAPQGDLAVAPREADREIKLGAGGLRDVEFSVQLIQLVHGRADDRVRQAGTLAALAKLIEFGYVGRSDGVTWTARTG